MTRGSPADPIGADKPEALAVSGLWKFFGPAEAIVRRRASGPDIRFLAENGLVPAVADAGFSVREGETFVIMGLSGSGKSTLLRCLCGLLPPSLGRVLVGGEDLTLATPARLREIRRTRLGMVFQHYALLPHQSVLENIAFPLRIQGWPAASYLARARSLAGLVGLTPRLHALPAELSGGQQQRVGIARSLANDPRLWLLDEPFSALDPLIRRELQDEVLRLKVIDRRTVIFITHSFDEAARVADRIAIMRDGRLVQIGTAADLILSPIDDYVARFAAEADRGRVLTLGAVLRTAASSSAGSTGAPGIVLPASLDLAQAARAARSHGGEIGVSDGGCTLLGSIAASRLLDLALGAAL